jgi:CheY-like chemotaxis protein
VTTWMIVEDEHDLYLVIDAMFETWGVDGVAFADGSEAVAWVDAVDNGHISGELPELALLDIRLPTLSGPEVGERLRRSAKLDNMAIVLITAYRLTADEEARCIELAQADALIYKPFPPIEQFRTMLDACVAKRKSAVS